MVVEVVSQLHGGSIYVLLHTLSNKKCVINDELNLRTVEGSFTSAFTSRSLTTSSLGSSSSVKVGCTASVSFTDAGFGVAAKMTSCIKMSEEHRI